MKQSIGEFLATLRKAHGYTQQEVADRLSVSNRTVSAWERGTVLPDILLLPALAELYGVTADEILAGERKQGAELAQKAELSEEAQTKLFKIKFSWFHARTVLVFGAFLVGYVLFFYGWWEEARHLSYEGFRWWLVLLFFGLVVTAFCVAGVSILTTNSLNVAEGDAQPALLFRGKIKKRVAIYACLAAAVSLIFATVSLLPIVLPLSPELLEHLSEAYIQELRAIYVPKYAWMLGVFLALAVGFSLFGFFFSRRKNEEKAGERQ